jgi:DeoR/GlpR family transcriptional regulator of sugar metabolism
MLSGLDRLLIDHGHIHYSSMAQSARTPRNDRVLPEIRRRAIAEYLRTEGGGLVADLEARFDVSSMTIRRDLHTLERQGLAKRTHGGAVAPGLAAQEDSFSQRVNFEVEAKQRLAAEAVSLLSAGETVFIDCSSSAYYVARQILLERIPASIVTNSVPVMQLFATADTQVELTGVGGRLRPLTLSLVGPAAVRTVREHFADKLFLSVKGLAGHGSLTDPDPLECEVKRAMIEQAEKSILLLAPGKIQTRGSHLIAGAEALSLVMAVDLSPGQLKFFDAYGVRVRCVV